MKVDYRSWAPASVPPGGIGLGLSGVRLPVEETDAKIQSLERRLGALGDCLLECHAFLDAMQSPPSSAREPLYDDAVIREKVANPEPGGCFCLVMSSTELAESLKARLTALAQAIGRL